MIGREPLSRRTHLATWLAQPMVRNTGQRRSTSRLTLILAFALGLLIGLII